MELYDIIFYLFAALTLISGVFVVTNRNVVHSAFFLMFTLLGISGLYVLLAADFIAVVQLMVYVGGILILLLFGVMITNKVTNVPIKSGVLNVVPSIVVVGLFAGALVYVMGFTNWNSATPLPAKESIAGIGELLINQYVLIFELLGILLLIALIGAASIARREKE